MDTKTTDEGVNRIKMCVAEKADPQFEIGAVAARRFRAGTGFLPQATAPESRLLLNVTVCAGEETRARPVHQVAQADVHAVFVEQSGTSSDPFHIFEITEDAAYGQESACMEHVCGANP